MMQSELSSPRIQRPVVVPGNWHADGVGTSDVSAGGYVTERWVGLWELDARLFSRLIEPIMARTLRSIARPSVASSGGTSGLRETLRESSPTRAPPTTPRHLNEHGQWSGESVGMMDPHSKKSLLNCSDDPKQLRMSVNGDKLTVKKGVSCTMRPPQVKSMRKHMAGVLTILAIVLMSCTGVEAQLIEAGVVASSVIGISLWPLALVASVHIVTRAWMRTKVANGQVPQEVEGQSSWWNPIPWVKTQWSRLVMIGEWAVVAAAVFRLVKKFYVLLKRDSNKDVKEAFLERTDKKNYFSAFDALFALGVIPVLGTRGPKGVLQVWRSIRNLSGTIWSTIAGLDYFHTLITGDKVDLEELGFAGAVQLYLQNLWNRGFQSHSDSDSDDEGVYERRDREVDFETKHETPSVDKVVMPNIVAEPDPTLWDKVCDALKIGVIGFQLRKNWREVSAGCKKQPVVLVTVLLITLAMMLAVGYVMKRMCRPSIKEGKKKPPSSPNPGDFEAPEEIRKFFRNRRIELDASKDEYADEDFVQARKKNDDAEFKAMLWMHDRAFPKKAGHEFASFDDITDEVVKNKKRVYTIQDMQDELDDPSSYMSREGGLSLSATHHVGCCHPSSCPMFPSQASPNKVCNTVCGGHWCTHWKECKPERNVLKETYAKVDALEKQVKEALEQIRMAKEARKSDDELAKKELDKRGGEKTRGCLYCKGEGHSAKECPKWLEYAAKRPCRNAAKGICPYGDKCKFQHPKKEAVDVKRVAKRGEDVGFPPAEEQKTMYRKKAPADVKSEYSDAEIDRVLEEAKLCQALKALRQQPLQKERLLHGPQFHVQDVVPSIGFARTEVSPGVFSELTCCKQGNRTLVCTHIKDGAPKDATIQVQYHLKDELVTAIFKEEDAVQVDTTDQKDLWAFKNPKQFEAVPNLKGQIPKSGDRMCIVGYSSYADFLAKRYKHSEGTIQEIQPDGQMSYKNSTTYGNCSAPLVNSDNHVLGWHYRGGPLNAGIAFSKEIIAKASGTFSSEEKSSAESKN